MKNLFFGIIGRRLFSALFLLTASAQLQAVSYKWWSDSDPRGHTVYFYDKEMRNGVVTTHLWHRDPVYGDDGTTVTGAKDSPFYEWENRKPMEFTGKKIEIDGEYYPVYRQNFYCNSYTADNYSADWDTQWEAPTHILLRHDESDASKCETTADFEFVDNALYGFDGVRIENFDESALVDVTDDDYSKYVIYVTGEPNKFSNIINSLIDYITVHVWGPDGDLSPWAFNGSCSFIEDNPATSYTDYQAWTDDYGYSPVVKYEFYYRGETPTNIIIKFRRMADDWDRQTADLKFVNGALYTIDEVNHYCEPIENPEISNRLPILTGDFYMIDTDSFYDYEYNDATGKYRLTTKVYSVPTFERSPAVGYTNYIDTTIETEEADVKFTKLGNRYYPVIKVTLGTPYNSVQGKISKIRLNVGRDYYSNRATGWMDFEPGNVYYFAGSGVVHPTLKYDDLELLDSMPSQEPQKKTIYVHLGANQLMEKELWKTPYFIPFKRVAGTNPAEPIYSDNPYLVMYPPVKFPDYIDPTSEAYTGSELEKCEMTCVSPGLYKYEFTDDGSYDDFVCFFWANERIVTKYVYLSSEEYWRDYEKYIALGAEWYSSTQYRYPVEWGLGETMAMTEMTASRSIYFDPVHWADYVYDIGVDCFHQSYLTPEEYFAVEDMIKENNVKALYLVGNEPISGAPMSDPSTSREIAEDHGCFFFDFDVTEELPASFKASVVNVPAMIEKMYPGSYAPQRGWASFNLGLIGPHKDTDDEDYDEWYESHVTNGGKSREICTRTNETYDYDNYTQYHWRIEVSEDHGMKAGRYYMVFDLLEEDRTVTVLDFDPHPHCYVNDINVRTIDITPDHSAQLHTGHYLAGSAHSGNVILDRVNVASGTITIGDTENSLIAKEGYEVVYTIYVDDREAFYQDKLTVEGRPEAIVADFLNLSADVRYAVRGRYHDLKTDRYFASKQVSEGIENLIRELPAPEVSLIKNQLMFYMSGETMRDFTLGAAVNLSYSVHIPDDNRYEYLPDYEVTEASLDDAVIDNPSAPLIDSSHFIVNNGVTPWPSYLGIGSDTPWQMHDGKSELTDANNWSRYIKNTAQLPVLIDRMRLYKENKVPKATATADFNIHAVYPFLVTDYEAKVTVIPDPALNEQSSPEALAGTYRAEQLPDNLDGYALVSIRQTTPIHVDFENDVVTGVEDVSADFIDGDYPAEYFNLQGMRVDARNLVPGVYIERKGNRTRKVLVD